jgi:hypothetical protein
MSYPDRIIHAPTELPGCVLWLDAAQGVTLVSGAVSQWADLSGANNHVTQATAGARPVVGVGQNGLPCVNFDGTDDILNVTVSIPQPQTVFIVGKFGGSGTGTMLCGGGNQMRFWRVDAGAMNVAGASANTLALPASTPDVWHVHSFQLNGVASSYVQDNAVRVRGNAGVATATGVGVGGLTGFGAPQYALCSVGEVIVFNRALTDGERASVERYLAKKWALAPVRAITAPTQLPGCTVWLDADDATSVTKDGSNLVSQWSDKSGLANHFTAASTFRPTHAASGIDFNGVGNRLYGPVASALITAAAYTVFVVFHADVIDSAGANYTNDALIADGAGFLGIHLTTGTPPNVIAYNWDGSADTSRGAIATGQKTLVTATHGGALLEVFVNGLRQAAATSGDTTNVANNLVLGVGGGFYYDGKIHEVVAFNRRLSDGERAQVEAYLTKKWSLYPTRSITSPLAIPGCTLWLDATDSSITKDGSNLVSQWNDLSGNARHATNGAGNATRPLYVPSAVAGKPALQFLNASDSYLDLPAGIAPSGDSDHTAFVVGQRLTGSGTATLAWLRLSTTTTTRTNSVIGAHNTTGASYFGAAAVATPLGDVMAIGQPCVLSKRYRSSTKQGSNVEGWLNSTGRTFETSTMTLGNTAGWLGCSISTASANFYVAEVLVFNRALTDGERSLVEQYLAAKYAL